jgi:exosortase
LINQLRVEWSINPQYSYGWGVPFLSLYLFWKRWQDRPDVSRPAATGSLILLPVLSLFLLLPIRLVQESNPEWRLVSWAYSLVVVSVSLAALWRMGGRPWLKHFSFPLAFVLIAVPWPTAFEQSLIQGLMRSVAAATVESINWCGIPAVQRGNIIELASGPVGVNEACSGVRSLQSTLMVALFFGELYRFTAASRFMLLAAGIALALLLNFLRTLLLTGTSIHFGPSALLAWHDPAGYLVLAGCCAGIWAIASRLSARSTPAIDAARPASAIEFPALRYSAAIIAWFLAVELGTELWYRAHERHLGSRRTWTVSWPVADRGFEMTPIPEDIRIILRYNHGRAGVWLHPDGSKWHMFYFRWRPGRAAAQLARSHTPETCLPATGLRMVAFHGVQSLSVKGGALPVLAYSFESNGTPLHVFYCPWEERMASTSDNSTADLSRSSRFKAVLEGRRHLGQQVLEIAVTGAPSQPIAQRQVAQFIQSSVSFDASPQGR